MKFIFSVLYDFLYKLISKYSGNNSCKIAIVRFDAIGDYLLFRNFLKAIKQSDKYSNFKIYFIGNKQCRELYDLLDKEYIDCFISIDFEKLKARRSIYKIITLLRLKLLNFNIIINPVHSRFYVYDDFLRDLRVKCLIGSSGDNIRNTYIDFHKSNLLYDKLVDINKSESFEFYRNLIFVRGLLNDHNLNVDFEIQIKPRKTFGGDIILSIGAGDIKRIWASDNFAELINWLKLTYPHREIVLIGSKADINRSVEIQSLIKHQINNLVGLTNLEEVIYRLKSAFFVVTHDSSTLHFCNALKVPNFCISNGQHFLRFHPCPETIFNKSLMVYPSDDYYNPSKYSFLNKLNEVYSLSSINDVKPYMLINCIKNEIKYSYN